MEVEEACGRAETCVRAEEAGERAGKQQQKSQLSSLSFSSQCLSN